MGPLIEKKASELIPFIQEYLLNNTSVRMAVTGSSMYPFLREHKDSVELSNAKFSDIKRDHIVLARRKTGEYVMHRVWRKEKGAFFIVGDAQTWIDGPYSADQLICAVKAVWRDNTRIDCNVLWWRFLCTLWMMLRRLVVIRNCFLKLSKLQSLRRRTT
jgi:signal peptidase I